MSSDTVLLAALGVLYLVDNSHRLPHGAFRFAFAPGAGWTVRGGPTDRSTWSVAFPLPLLHWSFALPASGPGSLRLEAFYDRYRRTRPTRALLSVLSSASILFLFVGFPLGKATFATPGATVALALSLATSTAVAVIAYGALRKLGNGRREAFRLSRGLVWPIQASAALARVFGRAAEDAHPLAVARVVLDDSAFDRLARPFAYDDHRRLLAGTPPELDGPTWDRLLYPRTLTAALALPPTMAFGGAAYCPRCAREYREAGGVCAECGVMLAEAAEAAPDPLRPVKEQHPPHASSRG